MAAKSKSRTALKAQTANPAHSVGNQLKAQIGNPFVGATVIETLLNVNSVLEFLADSLRSRDVEAPDLVSGEGIANICFALHNAIAHQAIALQEGATK